MAGHHTGAPIFLGDNKMDAKQFLTAVLGDEGQYCAVGIANEKGAPVLHEFRDTIDGMLVAAQEFDKSGLNTYFAVSTFNENPQTKKDPRKYRRLARNVRQIKCFFLDVDCGEDKPIPDQKAGVFALHKFQETYGLPMPSYVVNSGRGLHVYWVLDKPHSPDDWKPVAEKFKAACASAGFDVDTAVPADAARVLRVPNTHNYKPNPPAPVAVMADTGTRVTLDEFSNKFPDIAKSESDPALLPRTFSEQDREDMLAAMGLKNKTFKFSALVRKIVSGTGCNQIKRAIDTPNDLTYNQWLHVLSIAKFCEDGDKAIHLVSSKYDGYSEEETEKIAAGIEKPHFCSTFADDYPEGCKGCPHKQTKIRSPISLCGELKLAPEEGSVVEVVEVVEDKEPLAPPAPAEYEVDEEQDTTLVAPTTKSYHVPPYPKPYARGASGGVYHCTKDKDGEPEDILIHDNDLYMLSRLRDPIEGPCYLIRHHTKREGVHDFVTSGVTLSSPEEFRKEMCKNDIFVRAKNAERLMAYMEKWIKELQRTQDEIKVRTQFGWTENNQSFVVGDREITAVNVKPNPPGARTSQYFPYFKKKGSLEDWKKIPEFYNRPGFEPHQYMFGLSFGSPLMQFVPGMHGSTYNLTSADTGYGKTTGQMGGASVWGDPSKVIVKGQDTHHSLFLRAEVYKNIVLYVDEMSNLEGKQASEFCYAVSNGEQRNRLSNTGQNVERYRGDIWNLLVGATGNTSITERATKYRATPKGELGRVINQEATLLLTGEEDTRLGHALAKLLDENYGYAGEVYIQHIIANQKEVADMVAKTIEQLNIDAGLTAQHRFWSAQAAVVYVGTCEAKKIGLHTWDMDNLYQWCVARLREQKESLLEMNVPIAEIVRQYYAENVNRFLRIKSNGEDPQIGDLENLYRGADAMPINQWAGRHEYDVDKLYLLPAPFKTWCLQQNYHWESVRTRLVNEMGGKPKTVRLGSGTKIDIGSLYVYEVTLKDLEE